MVVVRARKKKLKVFRVWVDDCGYDQYDSCIIVGEDKESVLKQFETNKCGDRIYHGPINIVPAGKCWINYFFESDQGELHIEEVDLTAPALILGSFNAG